MVCLPKTWLDGMGIEVGDKVEMFFNGEIRLRKLEGNE